MKDPKFLIGFVIILLASALALRFTSFQLPAPPMPTVSNFSECAAAGYQILESYPRQCRTPLGQQFVEELPPPVKANLIRVTAPRPNDAIASPVIIAGEARGTWFFEASFPVTLVDAEGKILVQTYATAQGEWMTTEFVPFTAILTFNLATDTIGELILEKDNPSGLPENADELRVPVRITGSG